MTSRLRLSVALFLVTVAPLLPAQEHSGLIAGGGEGGSLLLGPASVQETLREDRIDALTSNLDRWNQWKDDLKERAGFEFTIEYNSVLQGYSDAGVGDDFSAGGIFRVSGRWKLFNRDGLNPGSIIYRFDHRHRYTTIAPQNAGIAAGSALPTATLFSDRGWGLRNLHWGQTILDGQAGIAVGWFPPDDYFHAYASADPLVAFMNLAFSIGGEIALPDSGIAVAAVGMLGEHFYAKGGVHDANGNAAEPNLDVFSDWELYKNFEIGWTSEKDRVFLDNFHVGVWHADAREDAGVPEGWGIVANASWYFQESRIAPFIRGGWSDGDAALLEAQVSAGVAKNFRARDGGGIAVSWGKPSASGTSDQWTGEIYYRAQLGNLAVTPNIQVILDPALNPNEDVLLIGSVRARIVF
jgi:porin